MKWLAVAVIALVAVAIAIPIASSSDSHRGSRPVAHSISLVAIGREYRSAMSATIGEMGPYASSIGAADSDASAATTAWLQLGDQYAQQVVSSYQQSLNNWPQEQQCITNAANAGLASPSTAAYQAAINECVQQGIAPQENVAQAKNQADEQFFARLQADATKASSAYDSLTQLFAKQYVITLDLPVPARLDPLKQEVLVSLRSVITDATAGESIVAEPVPALATKLAADVTALGSEVDALLARLGASRMISIAASRPGRNLISSLNHAMGTQK